MTKQTQQTTTITCDRCGTSKTYPADCSIDNEKGWTVICLSLHGDRELCPDCTEQFEAWWSSVGPK